MKAKTREEVCSLCGGRGVVQTTLSFVTVFCLQCHGLGYVVVRLNADTSAAEEERAERSS